SKRLPRGPYGLGVRVPMIVISPWSKGGWVSSEVFDHTSLLRFAERRFGVRADNITPWRRAVCGDLTSTLDFATPNDAALTLPSTVAYTPPDRKRHSSYQPIPPAEPHMPGQEPGQRPARAVPYELHVQALITPAQVGLTLRNSGPAAAVLQVRSRGYAPRSFTIGSGAELHDEWAAALDYELEVHGPNGFYRKLAGALAGQFGEPELRYDKPHGTVALLLPAAPASLRLTIRDGYTRQVTSFELSAGQPWQHSWPLTGNTGWYDLDVRCGSDPKFQRHFAGHLESGQNSSSDPQIGQNA
ncbi:MAG: phospholipase domain-containing protein, partial [Terriglobales bacterium]